MDAQVGENIGQHSHVEDVDSWGGEEKRELAQATEQASSTLKRQPWNEIRSGVSHLCRCRPQCSDSAFCVTAAIRVLDMFCPQEGGRKAWRKAIYPETIPAWTIMACVEGGHHGKDLLLWNRSIYLCEKKHPQANPTVLPVEPNASPIRTPCSPPPTWDPPSSLSPNPPATTRLVPPAHPPSLASQLHPLDPSRSPNSAAST